MSIVPNAFQVFNVYVDKAMELLTDAELRCLLFATRHIMGWQSTINERRGIISLTMFENGYRDKNGNYYGGCGLGRTAIITATNNLVTLGFLERVGKPTSKGQQWRLSERDVDWTQLEKRKTEKHAANQRRTQNATVARMKKGSSTSDDTSTWDDTDAGTSDVPPASTWDDTDAGTSDILNQSHRENHSQSHKQNHKDSSPDGESAAPAETETIITFKGDKLTPMEVAVIKAFHLPYGKDNFSWGYMRQLSNFFTGQIKQPGKKTRELYDFQFEEHPLSPEELLGFALWYDDSFEEVAEFKKLKAETHWRKWQQFSQDDEYRACIRQGGTALKRRIAFLTAAPAAAPEAPVEQALYTLEQLQALDPDFQPADIDALADEMTVRF